MTSRSRLFTAVEEAMRAVPNLAVEVDEQTISDFTAELRERGITEVERRRPQTKGFVHIGPTGAHELSLLLQGMRHDATCRLGEVAGTTVLIIDITEDDGTGRGFIEKRYAVGREGVLRL